MRSWCAWLAVVCLRAASALGAGPTITDVVTGTEDNRINAGGPDFAMLVIGSGFTPDSIPRLSGVVLDKAYLGVDKLHVFLYAQHRQLSGRFDLTISNPGQGVSNSWPVSISPVLSTVAPNVALAGRAQTVKATGVGFVATDVLVVSLSGQRIALLTRVINSQTLEADISASALTTAGAAAIEVHDPHNEVGSLQLPFSIEAQPNITSVSPNPVNAGGGYFPLSVVGTGFSPSCGVKLAETGLDTAVVSATQIIADVPTELRALSGTFPVTVICAAGSPSPPYSLRISPVLDSISPASMLAGSPAVTITAAGIGFTRQNALAITAGGQTTRLPTTYISSSALSAVVPQGILAVPQAVNIQVVNTAGLDVSASLPFTIRSAPAITSVTPNPMDAGGQSVVLTVTGAGFTAASVLQWNGTQLGTSFSSPNQLTATLSASLRALSGSFPLTVVDGGIASAQFPVTISPVLFSISPVSAGALSQSVTLTASGAGLTPGNIIAFNSQPLATTYASASTLTAVIPAAALVNPGSATVQILDSRGAGRSQTQAFTIQTPTPEISGLSPSEVAAAGSGFSLRVSGGGFYSASVVQWNGSPLSTSFSGPSLLAATVPATLVQSPGTAAITVSNGSVVSKSATLTIGPAPAPTLERVNPSIVTAGSPTFTFAVHGAGFLPASIAQWNGADVPTSYVSATQVTAAVPAAQIAQTGTASITVTNPGGSISNRLTVRIDPPRPAISSLTPSSIPAGAPALTVNISGTHFAENCEVRWNDTRIASSRASEVLLVATVPSTLLAVAGTAAVTVANPNGMVSEPAGFVVSVSNPAITALSPGGIALGSPGFVLSVHGYNFADGAAVQWNGSPLATTFVSPNELTASVPADRIASAGAVQITVRNPGALISRAAVFQVMAPPSITAVLNSFSSSPSAAPGSLISIYGSNLTAGESTPVVSIDGKQAPIFYSGATQINAQVPFEVGAGEATVSVETLGVRSAPARLEIKDVAPGILLAPGSDRALAQDSIEGTLIGPQNPARPGRYVTVYLTGQGRVDPPVATGNVARAEPLSLPVAAVEAFFGDVPAEVAFAGLGPGMLGVLQVNLVVPTVAAGDQALRVVIGGVAANRATLPVGF